MTEHAEPTVASLSEELRVMRDNYSEAITELELALEDVGWNKLSGADEREFTRDGLRKICKNSFLFYEKNPLIGRAVDTQAHYVFGQGVTIKAAHPLVDEVVQTFVNDRKNKKVFSSVIQLAKLEKDANIDGNLFFALFRNNEGQVRVSTIVFDEIWDTITNPEDRNEVWFYERRWTQKRDSSGRFVATGKMFTEYYPDWEYRPANQKPTYNGKTVHWESPVYHVAVNRVLNQKFGLSEIYSAQDWAQAYNKFLQNWATIVRSYARFAWQITKKAGSASRLAVKNKLDSKISSGQYQPSPATAGVAITDDATKMLPLRTAGATTSAEDGRRLLLMVCAATGLPETFYGDVSVGTLATARSLNRPTELAFSLRQLLWETVIEGICEYVIRSVAEVGYTSDDPNVKGTLSGEWEPDAWEEETFVFDTENENPDLRGKPIDTTVNVDFPKLVEDDQKAQVDAIVASATLNGSPFAGTIDAKYTTERLLRVLGETSIEEVIEKLFPEGEEPEAVAVAGAVQDLQQAIEAMSEAREIPISEVVTGLAGAFIEAVKSKEAE